jgi:hypothetical protein
MKTEGGRDRARMQHKKKHTCSICLISLRLSPAVSIVEELDPAVLSLLNGSSFHWRRRLLEDLESRQIFLFSSEKEKRAGAAQLSVFF